MGTRLLRWSGRAIPGLLLACLIIGFVVPVYSDEIGWRFQERAGFDGVDKMFSEICGPNTLAVPPWFMMPVRWYSSIFNGAFPDPFWIRVSGVAYAVITLVMLLVLIRRVTVDPARRAILSTVGPGLLCLGTMPLLMVWSRPEQPIVMAALGMMLIVFADGAGPDLPRSTARQAWLRSGAILLLAIVAISYHVKGLFLLPMMLACLFFASRGSKAHIPRLIAGVLIVAATFSALSYWSHRLDCPDNAAVARIYNMISLGGAISHISSLADAWKVAVKMANTLDLLLHIANIGPRPDPMAAWLEWYQVGKHASFLWFAALSMIWVLALLAAGAVTANGAWRFWRDRRLDPRLVLAVLVFGITVTWSATLTIPNIYEEKFTLVLLAVAIVLALSTWEWESIKPLVHFATAVVGLAAVVSPIGIAAIYGPSLVRGAEAQGKPARQPFSVGVFSYGGLKRDIVTAARLCGIGDPAKAHALMVDDVTYFTYMRSTLPQHELGVMRGWSGKVDSVAYLRSRGSDGAIVSCSVMKPELRKRAKSVGKFCCLGPPNW